MKYLDREEKELIDSFNRGEWVPVKSKNKKKYIDVAKANYTKDKRINIRLTTKDYINIQAKALEEGIPYQTLISSIIHKYNSGKLKSVV
ncbi:MAG: hypothetical protein GY936_07380 [Ignavibacteriae bacterium]|nr:hypothetical protein [Ignavibacteriota bacterium]